MFYWFVQNPETPLKRNTKLSPLDVYKINLLFCKEPESSTTDESTETTNPFVSTTETETETETETTTDPDNFYEITTYSKS